MKITIKMEPLPVKNNDPNGTLIDWLSTNQDNYDIHSIVFCKDNKGKLCWNIYYVEETKNNG